MWCQHQHGSLPSELFICVHLPRPYVKACSIAATQATPFAHIGVAFDHVLVQQTRHMLTELILLCSCTICHWRHSMSGAASSSTKKDLQGWYIVQAQCFCRVLVAVNTEDSWRPVGCLHHAGHSHARLPACTSRTLVGRESRYSIPQGTLY